MCDVIQLFPKPEPQLDVEAEVRTVDEILACLDFCISTVAGSTPQRDALKRGLVGSKLLKARAALHEAREKLLL